MNAARYTEKKAKTKVRKKCVLKFKKIDYNWAKNVGPQ